MKKGFGCPPKPHVFGLLERATACILGSSALHSFWHPCYFLCCTITWKTNKLHFKNSLIDCGKSAAFLRKSSLCTPVKYKYNTPLSSTPIFMPTPKNMVDCLHQTLHFLQLSNVCVYLTWTSLWSHKRCLDLSGQEKGRQENTNNFMFLFYSLSCIVLKWFFMH